MKVQLHLTARQRHRHRAIRHVNTGCSRLAPIVGYASRGGAALGKGKFTMVTPNFCDIGSDTIKIATICTGLAASMASVLLCAGEKGMRCALPHARVMIHQPMGGADGQATDMEITVREILKLKKELYTIISDHSGQPYDKVYADSDRDYWMTSAEALEYGMIDKVLERTKK